LKYAVEILRSAQKSLSIIQAGDRAKINHTIRSLADDPRPNGSRKLTAREAWRIRIGKYPVIYQIFDNRLVVSVVSIGHRKDIYRK
jgi:mRNA interferase RelE/StbE